MKRVMWVFAGALLLTGVVSAREPTPTPQVTGADQLVKKKGLFGEKWVRPDADITKNSKLLVWQPAFAFRDVGGPQGGDTTTGTLIKGGEFAVREEDRQRFAKIVSEAFVKELERGEMFQVVNEAGPNTLILRSAVLDISWDVPPPNSSMSRVYLTSIGQATIVFQLIAAETGVIQATVGERQEIQSLGQRNRVSGVPVSENNVWIQLERWAGQAAKDLRRQLEKAKKRAR